MNAFPLQLRDGHLFIELNGELWLLDTGAPNSFGTNSKLSLAGIQFELGSNYLGLTAATLFGFVGVQCVGLLGADVLGRFDIIFDVPNNTVSFSTEELSFPGQPVPLSEFMGIPILTAQIRGRDFRMFFDTAHRFLTSKTIRWQNFPPLDKSATSIRELESFRRRRTLLTRGLAHLLSASDAEAFRVCSA